MNNNSVMSVFSIAVSQVLKEIRWKRSGLPPEQELRAPRISLLALLEL
ncbi:MAG: hypothetical protein QF435_08125 [Arenicellales bacterium]|nr:hypothetical protein [Arenicellales bacterium]